MNKPQKEKNDLAKLEYYVSHFRIFMDTNCFFQSNYNLFIKKAEPFILKQESPIIVPARVLEELDKVGKREPNLREKSREALTRIAEYTRRNLVLVLGNESDHHVVDELFLSLFTQYRLKYNLLLITADKKLATEIEQLGTSPSVRGIKMICAKRINKEGFLYTTLQKSQSHTSTPQAHSTHKEPASPFSKGNTARVDNGETLPVSAPCTEGCKLSAKSGNNTVSVQLGEHLAAGGEGDIYEIPHSNSVAKIYMPEKNTRMRRDKLELMLRHNVKHQGICFPTALLYNTNNEFVGYQMPKAKGYPLQYLFNNLFLQQKFPDWKKKDLVTLCITLLNRINYLHKMNVILGDINPNNILVASPTEVYFVDTDSYQIEDFPCPVGVDHFTAPEILGRNFQGFLRSTGNEQFAVATLLFMIMMMGKAPYAKQNGGSVTENIRNGDFSFPLGEASNKLTPDGHWRFIWSHLSRNIKEAFYHSFHRDGKYRTEEKRLSDLDWLRLFRKYLHGLNNGMLDHDAMSGELYPTRYKYSDNVPQKKCHSCGKMVPLYNYNNGICSDCACKNTHSPYTKAYSHTAHIIQKTHDPGSYTAIQKAGTWLANVTNALHRISGSMKSKLCKSQKNLFIS